MKKTIAVVALAVLIVILVLFAIYLKPEKAENPVNNTTHTETKTNQTLHQQYAMLNNGSFMGYPIARTNYSSIGYNDSTGKINCNGQEVSPKHASSYSTVSDNPNNPAIGGFYDTYIFDCSNIYYVYMTGDAGPRLFGPFNK